ncbi:TIGR00730 family Rossman fold protein [Methylocystis parvus]|uniref:Cytokinin riboside 5'-monophosphate phosphoribohydrolase n=1 Tax=Methylocystis parvus TaxID=134 RepID=A0A6B8M978_9HYPH|nr:TIGR00730 family Rossman fold protein [Methylocystis parvus]QGM99148.1 TIGR00730 family Rossman fold protein [Methylocystis parvus]WBK00479.1 TIGR00730 family Rossman fold protein [Methylocystis parvus OBBP]
MQKIKNICVYCGSAEGDDPRYAAAAESFGKALARADIGLVFGGGSCGLMGVVARSTLNAGGRVTGIIPSFLDEREIALQGITDLILVEDMHTRKRLMFEKSDAFVALPGGVGTLEELTEQLTWVQLGRHTKPLVIADIAGFWRPLLTLFAHMHNSGFIREGYDVRYMVAERVEDILPMILTTARRTPEIAETAVTERM